MVKWYRIDAQPLIWWNANQNSSEVPPSTIKMAGMSRVYKCYMLQESVEKKYFTAGGNVNWCRQACEKFFRYGGSQNTKNRATIWCNDPSWVCQCRKQIKKILYPLCLQGAIHNIEDREQPDCPLTDSGWKCGAIHNGISLSKSNELTAHLQLHGWI